MLLLYATLVPRILGPIVACLENLEKLCEKDAAISDMVAGKCSHKYVHYGRMYAVSSHTVAFYKSDHFGGLEALRIDILYDFFRSAFDGSGADNFYDAGK